MKKRMKADARLYDIFGAKLRMPGGTDSTFALAWMLALYLSKIGTRLLGVTGDVITGTLSGADKIFTRDDGKFFVRSQVLTVENVVGTDQDETYRIGEGITQTGSGAKGVVRAVNPGETTTILTVDTITVALFVGSDDIAGDDSTVAADVTTVETKAQNLKNFLVFAHVSGNTQAGEFVQVSENDETTLTTGVAMMSGATAIVMFQGEDAAAMAVEVGLQPENQAPAVIVPLSSASETLPVSTLPMAYVCPIDCSGNAVNAVLPDVRQVPEGHEYAFVGVDVVSNAFTITAQNAAQTLDGVDISAGGTPFADVDANGDSLVIRRSGAVWIIAQNEIS